MTTTMLSPAGFLVLESCEDYEQVLSLDTSKGKPDGGILTWPERNWLRCYFTTRQAARAAIKRTEHYRLAFDAKNMPEAKNCRIEMVAEVKTEDAK